MAKAATKLCGVVDDCTGAVCTREFSPASHIHIDASDPAAIIEWGIQASSRLSANQRGLLYLIYMSNSHQFDYSPGRYRTLVSLERRGLIMNLKRYDGLGNRPFNSCQLTPAGHAQAQILV